MHSKTLRSLTIACVGCVILFVAGPAHAFWWYEIRPIPALGLIKVDWGPLGEVQPTSPAQRRQLARQNIYLPSEQRLVRGVRSLVLGKHKVTVTLTIEPPIGHGPGGQEPTARLVVVIDGVKKIDCSFGPNGQTLVEVSRITLSSDGSIDGQVRHIEVTFNLSGGRSLFSTPEELAEQINDQFLTKLIQQQRQRLREDVKRGR